MSASMSRNLLSFTKFLLVFTIGLVIQHVISEESHLLHDFFLCRKCGREIVELADMINMPSELSLMTKNETFGPKKKILIQAFKNPHANVYQVVTARKADVYRLTKETGGYTWWPGFNWIIIACPQCKQHIGWEYLPQDKADDNKKTFFGLILTNLLYENDADNLIVMPKTYTS